MGRSVIFSTDLSAAFVARALVPAASALMPTLVPLGYEIAETAH